MMIDIWPWVRKTDACWFWAGHIAHGQAVVYTDGHRQSAARLVWQAETGHAVPFNQQLRPQCPSGQACIRPDHRRLAVKTDRPPPRHRERVVIERVTIDRQPLDWWYERANLLGPTSCGRCGGAMIPAVRDSDDGGRALVHHCAPCGQDTRPYIYQDGDVIRSAAEPQR